MPLDLLLRIIADMRAGARADREHAARLHDRLCREPDRAWGDEDLRGAGRRLAVHEAKIDALNAIEAELLSQVEPHAAP